ncbi:hypothetical protein [Nocardiopsis sp. CC223A]|uniref:hypothetical protein n=1 Tax=Nocardiopsis sp. CC223A TaxID=3044051 RepID=UPI00278BEB6E|nr:hypothetical protein [Nocardiopsis sp. CC223A]
MQCIAGEHAPLGTDHHTSTVVRGRAGARHLRPAELAAVRRSAGMAFALNHGGAGADLLSPEFSPLFTRPLPPRQAETGGLTSGRVIPLRPDLVGWTRPLTGGGPLRLLPGRGRHHRPETPLHSTLEGYTHRTPAPPSTDQRIATCTGRTSPLPVSAPERRPAIRRCASRVRAYVAHPARDLAPLALAVRTYLSQGVR